jgi:glycosyltransferase involved in cell wall biosynthesis
MTDQPINRSTDQRLIGIDATCWTQRRGYGRHLRGLITAAARLSPHRFVLFTDFAGESPVPFPDSCEVVAASTRRQTLEAAGADGSRSVGDMLALGRAISAAPLDVLFFPTIYSWVPTWTSAPKLLMIHDVIAERLPRYIFPTLGGRLRWQVKSTLGLAQADRILTVSEYSRRALVEQFGLFAESVAVVGEAPDPVFRPLDEPEPPRVFREFGLRPGCRVISYVGGFGPHKNLARLLDAFAKIAAEPRFADVTLMLAGDHSGDVFYSEYARLRRFVEERRLQERVIFPGFVADDELVGVLNSSAFLALPSLMEGYGLPAIEAAACGVPVLVTENSPIPELLADGALAVDPYRTEHLRESMVRLLDDAGLRGRMGVAAHAAAARLTWDAAARSLLRVVDAAAIGIPSQE